MYHPNQPKNANVAIALVKSSKSLGVIMPNDPSHAK